MYMCTFCIKCVMMLSGNGQAQEIRLDFLNLVKEIGSCHMYLCFARLYTIVCYAYVLHKGKTKYG